MIVLDASIVIAVASSADVFHHAAVKALTAAQESGEDLLLPASAYSEALVWPVRQGQVDVIDDFVDRMPLRFIPIDRAIARTAARLRGVRPGLRLPDALVLATGEELEAATVLTTDARWRTISPRVRVLT